MFLVRLAAAGLNPFSDSPVTDALGSLTGGVTSSYATSSLSATSAFDDHDDDDEDTLDDPSAPLTASSKRPQQPARPAEGSSIFSPIRKLFSSAPSRGSRALTTVPSHVEGIPGSNARAHTYGQAFPPRQPVPSASPAGNNLLHPSRRGRGSASCGSGGYCSPSAIWQCFRGSCFSCCSTSPLGCQCCAGLFAPPTVPIASLPLTPTQQERLASLRSRALERFDATREEHRSELYSFAVAVFGPSFPIEELNRSPRWAAVGFQGLDPATDFRGAGVLGLQNLLYLAGLEPRLLKRAAQKDPTDVEHYLPFAIAGLNVTFMLLEALSVTAPVSAQLSQEAAEVYAGFTDLLAAEQFAFEEVYRAAMLALDDMWTDMNAKYTQFPMVLGAVRAKVQDALRQRPVSVGEFARLINADMGIGIV